MQTMYSVKFYIVFRDTLTHVAAAHRFLNSPFGWLSLSCTRCSISYFLCFLIMCLFKYVLAQMDCINAYHQKLHQRPLLGDSRGGSGLVSPFCFWWLVVSSYNVHFQVCPQMYCIFTYIANDNTTFWCRLTWRQRIGFSTLLFGRHHQSGCSSPSTAVNMGETKEMQHFKEKLPEKNSFRYCCNYYGLGFFVFSSWVGGE